MAALSDRDVAGRHAAARAERETQTVLPCGTIGRRLLPLLAVCLVAVPCGEGSGMRAGDANDAGAAAVASLTQKRGRILLSLRGGGVPEAGEGAGMATVLLEPSFDAAHIARQADGTRVSFEDFPPSKREAHQAKRKRHERSESGHPGEEGKPARAKSGYEKLFEDCYNPDRPGFVVPDLPQYEPESDELAQDNEEIPVDAETEARLAGCGYEEWLQVQDEHEARLQQGRRHKENDYGQGYLEGRWGKDDIMGWVNYKALPQTHQTAPQTLSNEPQYRLDRHLWHAAETGDVQLVQLLMKVGANVSSCNNESFLPAKIRYGLNEPNSYKAINESARATYGYVDAEKGEAEIAVYCWPALHWATNSGHESVVSFLVAPRESGGGGAPLDATDWKKLTALHLAAAAGHTSIVRILLQAGSQPNANDTVCNSPMHFAAFQGHLEVMQLLMQSGAAVNHSNTGASTPLHWAAQQGQLEAVKMLLQHGVDPRKLNNNDLTPLNLAEAADHVDVADILAEAMNLVKIGPAEMDSVTRLAFAQKVKLRIQTLEEKLVAAQAARQSGLAAGAMEGVEDGEDTQTNVPGTTRMPLEAGAVDKNDATQMPEEFQLLYAELERQQASLREVEELETKYAEAEGPKMISLPGGYVQPPIFPHDRENPFLLDIKPQTTVKVTGAAPGKAKDPNTERGDMK